jgi:hypothetical protein
VGRGALLDGLGQVLPQVKPVGDLDRPRRPVRALSAYDPDLSRQMTSTPDERPASQPVAGVAALDEVQRGASLDVDEQRVVARPRRIVKSSTPSTRGDAACGSGTAMTAANDVLAVIRARVDEVFADVVELSLA